MSTWIEVPPLPTPVAESVPSPALLFFRDRIVANLERLLQMVEGRAERLCPHVKTHKTRQIVGMEVARGIVRHKCATLEEARLLAEAGAQEVLIAYPVVGPNVPRLIRLAEEHPQTEFAVCVDSLQGVRQLAEAARRSKTALGVYLDLDVGMHRTGVPIGEEAERIYAEAGREGFRLLGLHAYDGHNHDPDPSVRRSEAKRILEAVLEFRDRLRRRGLPCSSVVIGGTPPLAFYAESEEVILSPGTVLLHDAEYTSRYPELPFRPAAFLLARVISRPRPDRITLDLGYKAISPDRPGAPGMLPEHPHLEPVGQSEEHWVFQRGEGPELAIGQPVLVAPRHICPTVALHRYAWVCDNGELVDRWEIAARDRVRPEEVML